MVELGERQINPSGRSGRSQVRTLDLEHGGVVNGFTMKRDRLRDIHVEIEALSSSASALEAKGRSSLSENDLTKLMDTYDRRDALQKEARFLESSSDEVDYYMRTGAILFKYYDILEKGASAAVKAKMQDRHEDDGCEEDTGTTKKNSILKYFSSSKVSTCSSSEVASTSGTAEVKSLQTQSRSQVVTNPVITATNNNKNDDRASLLERFMYSVDTNCPSSRLTFAVDVSKDERGGPDAEDNTTRDDVSYVPCTHCGRRKSRTVLLQEGYAYCNFCMTVEYILVDHDKPSYKDPPKEIAYFAYKRINHFNEWLNQVQGKETTDIPDDVYDNILLEIKKQKLNNMAELTRKKVKEILKKLKINKYYEHVPHIINRLNGMPSPHFPPELEDRLRHMFCQIQVPFLKHSPLSRKNFLSYSFCLHKMMQLLEKDQYLESFPLLKSREKLAQQDAIWKKICEELGWDFIPSL